MTDYPASNEALADCYKPDASQVIIVFPLVWKHHPGENWELIAVLDRRRVTQL